MYSLLFLMIFAIFRYLRSKGMTQGVVDYLMWHHFGRNPEERNHDLAQVCSLFQLSFFVPYFIFMLFILDVQNSLRTRRKSN